MSKEEIQKFIQNALEEKQNLIIKISDTLAVTHKLLQTKVEEIKQIKKEKSDLEDKVNKLNKVNSELIEANNKLERTILDLSKTETLKEDEKKVFLKKIHELQSQTEQISEKLKKTTDTYEAKLKECNEKNKNLETEKENINRDFKKCNDKSAKLEQENKTIDSNNKNLTQQLNLCNDKSVKLEQDNKKIDSNNKSLTQQLNLCNDKSAKLEEEIKKNKKETSTLKELNKENKKNDEKLLTELKQLKEREQKLSSMNTIIFNKNKDDMSSIMSSISNINKIIDKEKIEVSNILKDTLFGDYNEFLKKFNDNLKYITKQECSSCKKTYAIDTSKTIPEEVKAKIFDLIKSNNELKQFIYDKTLQSASFYERCDTILAQFNIDSYQKLKNFVQQNGEGFTNNVGYIKSILGCVDKSSTTTGLELRNTVFRNNLKNILRQKPVNEKLSYEEDINIFDYNRQLHLLLEKTERLRKELIDKRVERDTVDAEARAERTTRTRALVNNPGTRIPLSAPERLLVTLNVEVATLKIQYEESYRNYIIAKEGLYSKTNYLNVYTFRETPVIETHFSEYKTEEIRDLKDYNLKLETEIADARRAIGQDQTRLVDRIRLLEENKLNLENNNRDLQTEINNLQNTNARLQTDYNNDIAIREAPNNRLLAEIDTRNTVIDTLRDEINRLTRGGGAGGARPPRPPPASPPNIRPPPLEHGAPTPVAL